MLSPLIALVTVAQAQDGFEKYVAFVKASPCFQVNVQSFQGGFAGPKAVLTLERGKRLRIDSKWRDKDYTGLITPAGLRELDRVAKLYDEVPQIRQVGGYPSRISSVPGAAIPGLLFITDLKKQVPKGATVAKLPSGYQFKGKQKDSMGGETEYELRLDLEGRFSFIDVKVSGPMGVEHNRWVMSDYRIVPPANRFEVPLPNGYVPYSLEIGSFPLQLGEAAPLKGWVDSKSGRKVDLSSTLGGSPALLVFLGEGAPNVAARKSLAKISKAVKVVKLGSSEGGGYLNPKGDLIAKMRPMGTPMFYLIDKTGRVARSWFGFDVDAATEWEQDVLNAAKRIVATPAASPSKNPPLQ